MLRPLPQHRGVILVSSRMLHVAVLAAAAVLVAAVPALAAPQPGEPSQGSNFKLFGNAKDDLDPENPFNEVFSIDTTSGGADAFGGVARDLGDHIKVDMLDNQIEVKYYFVGRTCAAGSPRFQLFIDPDGKNGPMAPHNAFGYLGESSFVPVCPMNQWVFEDMTNSLMKWDLSQFGGSQNNTWDQVEAFFAAFPNHQVLQGSFVDDSASFSPTGRGCAYFDVLSIGAKTLTDNGDTEGDKPQGTNN